MNLNKSISYCLVLLTCGTAIAQIAQDKPGLCGRGNQYVGLPLGISAVPGETFSTLFIRKRNSEKSVPIQATMSSVEEVCPISGNRLLVFGGTDTATSVVILDQKAGNLVDSFFAYDPVTSPDQNWIAFRDFYPPQTEMPVSEEYLLYDLTKDKAGNRLPNPDPDLEAVGRVVYPPVAGDVPFIHGGLPADQTHQFRSNAFYWSGDSRMVVFADSVEKNLSIILVTINGDQTQAFVHKLTPAEACEQGSKGDVNESAHLTLTHAQVSADGIELQFKSSDYGSCKPIPVVLTQSDFVPAQLEVHHPRTERTIRPWSLNRGHAETL